MQRDSTSSKQVPRSRTRYFIVAMLFLVTALNYGDRATLSMVGSPMAKDLGLDMVGMGYVFSAFSWAYVIGQMPGGWLLDRFGSKRVYFWSIFTWSSFTLLQGFCSTFHDTSIIIAALFLLRFLVGLAESPSFPGNSRIVAAWFPSHERGTASAIFNSAQYFATVMFAPLMGWLIHILSWQSVFFFMGGLGIVVALLWQKTIYGPKEHPAINTAELEYIEQGGALVNMDQRKENKPDEKLGWRSVKQLISSRMMMGIYIGQYCINALTYFFITWFPVYLVQERHMSILKAGFIASIPAVCGFLGGVLGGVISDRLLKTSGSLTLARKVPIVAGMLMSMTMVGCNYVSAEWLVIALMSIAFLGKGIGALGWAVMSDTAPKEIGGMAGGLFNMFGNMSGIVTPIAIGYILKATGSFNGALVFVSAHALLAIMSFLVVVGPLKRFELR